MTTGSGGLALGEVVAYAQPFDFTHISAATAAVTNRFVTSANMKVGAYTVANSGAMPTAGARHVTVTATAGDTADTMGTIEVVGTDLAGNTISETLAPVAGSTVTGTKWFKTVTSVTGAGWVIDGAEGTNDTIVVGCAAAAAVVEGDGVLHAVAVNTTAAGTITIADSTGTIGILKSSITEGTVYYDCAFSDYLTLTVAAASDVTVMHRAS